MKKLLVMLSVLSLTACVSGPPKLTGAQMERAERIVVFAADQTVEKKYTEIGEVVAADCSGAPGGGRVWGNAETAIRILKMKAAVMEADAIMNTSCGAAPLVNNCWAAKKCTGTAIKWQ